MVDRQISRLVLVAAVTIAAGAFAQQAAPAASVATIPGPALDSTTQDPALQTADPPRKSMKDAEGTVPIELAPDNTRHSFHLRLDEQSLIRHVMNAYGIQASMDASVKSQIVNFDADDLDFKEASSMMKLATDTFLVPLDSLRVLAAADTKENRMKYELQVMETIAFPGLSASELNDMQNLAHNVFGAERSAIEAGQNKMTVRAPSAELEAMNQACVELLAGKSELKLDVGVYEVDQSKSPNAGVVLPSSATLFNAKSEINSIIANNSTLVDQIISSGLASAGDYTAILAILLASGELSGTVFNSSFVLFGGGWTETGAEWNTTTANLLLSSSDVRSLNQTQLLVLDQEEATFRSGKRYPIMASSYTGLTSSSSSTSSKVTTPQVKYEDLGLTLKVKPHIEGEEKVTLDLNLKLESLAGSTINDIPVLANRQYTSVVSLRLGESALVVSAMSKEDSSAITGIPGLSEMPGLHNSTDWQDTTDSLELVILVTPHIVRLTHREPAGAMLLLPLH
jgi:type II secretory pathway component GspD/PulD (secretin)